MATCDELRNQLTPLLNERNNLVIEKGGDEGDLKELESESHEVNPTILAKARQKVEDDKNKLKQLDQQIATLNASANAGVIFNDQQPYPVYGWIEVGYSDPQIGPIIH